MANKKISALTALSNPAAADELPIVDKSDTTGAATGTTKKVTVADIANAVGGATSVTAYGATGDGTTDDTVAIQAAANSGASRVFFPAGTYRLTTTVTVPAGVVLQGEPGAVILFDNFAGSNGFSFSASTTVGDLGGIKSLELVASTSNVGKAIVTPQSAAQYTTYLTRYVFEDIYCRGENDQIGVYANAWDFGAACWLEIGDCISADVERITIQGQWDIGSDPSGQTQDTGIRLTAASALLGCRMSAITIGPIYTALELGDRVFFSLKNFDFIGCHRGIYESGTTTFNESKVTTGNVNAQSIGIYFDSASAREVNGVTIRRHSSGWKGGSAVWTGFSALSCSQLVVDNIVVQPDESGGAFTGTMTAVRLDTCSLGKISGVEVGSSSDIGIALDDCTGMLVTDTISAQNDAGDVLFDLSNNTRLSTIGAYALVSTFAGTVLNKDGTVTSSINMINRSFDLQNTGNVTHDLTRTGSASNEKKWRTVVAATTQNRQVVSDAGSGTNYEIITRSGTTVTGVEWRSQGPILGKNTTTGGGNPTISLAPDFAAEFAQLADAGTRDYDYDPGADGYYSLAYEFRLVTGGGSYRKVAVTQDFKRVSGVCSLEGSAVTLDTGVQTGVAVAFSIVSDDVRVTVTNTTGSTLDGHCWRGVLAGDLPS